MNDRSGFPFKIADVASLDRACDDVRERTGYDVREMEPADIWGKPLVVRQLFSFERNRRRCAAK